MAHVASSVAENFHDGATVGTCAELFDCVGCGVTAATVETAMSPQRSPRWRSNHNGVEVAPSDAVGARFGLHATQHFKKGDMLFQEMPLVFVQSYVSAAVIPACLNCGALLGGSVREILERSLEGCRRGNADGYAKPSLSDFPRLLAGAGGYDGPLDDTSLRLPEAVACPLECGAFFCSEACRDRQLVAGHHRVICGDLPHERRNGWQVFVHHARDHHETFLLAAFLVAQVACDVLHGGCAAEDAVARYTHFFAQPWPERLPPDAPGRPSWVTLRWDVLEASRQLLLAILDQVVPAGVLDLLSPDGYARIVGMLDLVCYDLTTPNPLDKPLSERLTVLPIQVRTDVRRIGLLWMRSQRASQEAEKPTAPEESDEEDLRDVGRRVATLPLLPRFDGFGLSPTVALMNHSCAPNAEVGGDGSPTELVVKAVQDIRPGEEILICYCDDQAPIAGRQRLLWREYGFMCACSLCEAQKKA
eukprot:TRINITY_DN16096_c0_g1_i1.p1 TRINITY_DN16096_c0_g1~~TRINITY_DN16096_c0_g1_i1.p1  ORF type:complete len:511 (-),score=100.59 TRINITY_DN16096_c0_g1_i1:65-1489(-)